MRRGKATAPDGVIRHKIRVRVAQAHKANSQPASHTTHTRTRTHTTVLPINYSQLNLLSPTLTPIAPSVWERSLPVPSAHLYPLPLCGLPFPASSPVSSILLSLLSTHTSVNWFVYRWNPQIIRVYHIKRDSDTDDDSHPSG